MLAPAIKLRISPGTQRGHLAFTSSLGVYARSGYEEIEEVGEIEEIAEIV